MDGAYVDGNGCIQCVVDAGGHWCVYGITRTDNTHYFWVGEIHGTLEDATLVMTRVTDTSTEPEKDTEKEKDTEPEQDATDPQQEATDPQQEATDPQQETTEPEQEATERETASKLRLVGKDIVWSDDSKWTKVMLSPAQCRLIMRSPPNPLSLIGLFFFVCKTVYVALTGKR